MFPRLIVPLLSATGAVTGNGFRTGKEGAPRHHLRVCAVTFRSRYAVKPSMAVNIIGAHRPPHAGRNSWARWAQRVLSHQMAGLLAERMATTDMTQRVRADADLAAAERRFLASFEALSGTPNDRRAAAAALATAELRKAYYDGDNAVAATVSKIAQGIEDVRQGRMPRNGAAEFIAWLRGPVISTLDKAVTAHKAAAASTLHKLRVYQAVDIGLLLLVLVLEVTFVFAPLARRLASQTRELVVASERQAATLAEMAKLASTDPLTGLSNRRALDTYVAAIDRASAAAGPSSRVGVVSFDLDWCKDVNDSHGHAAGDAVLQAVGQRVRSVCRAEDFAARIGGDEFIVLLADAPSSDYVREIAERIRAMICAPVSHQGLLLSVGASVGICIVPEQAETLTRALHLADLALRSAKRAGKSRCMGIIPADALVDDAMSGQIVGRVLQFPRAQAV